MRDTPISASWEADLRSVHALLLKENEHDRIHRCYDSVPELLARVLDHKRCKVAEVAQNTRQFQEDVLTFLRAFSLMLETVGSATTHGEKAARLRGLVELVESAAQKVREHQFRGDTVFSYGVLEDVFRADYPVRHWMQKAKDSEERAKAAEDDARKIREMWAPKPSVETAPIQADPPF